MIVGADRRKLESLRGELDAMLAVLHGDIRELVVRGEWRTKAGLAHLISAQNAVGDLEGMSKRLGLMGIKLGSPGPVCSIAFAAIDRMRQRAEEV